jgi:hypothetical protein
VVTSILNETSYCSEGAFLLIMPPEFFIPLPAVERERERERETR